MSDPLIGPPGSADPGTQPNAVPDTYVFSSFDGRAAAETPGRRRVWRIAAIASVGLLLIAVVAATGLMITRGRPPQNSANPQKSAGPKTVTIGPIADPGVAAESPLTAYPPPGSSPSAAALPGTSNITNPTTPGQRRSPSATAGSPPPPHSSQPPVAPPATTQAAVPGRVIIGQQSQKCLRANPADGSPVQLWTCDDSAAEKWVIMADSTIRSGGLCLDAAMAGMVNGTVIQVARCSGNPAQRFTFNSAREIVGSQSGLCVDARDFGTANGTAIQLWDCWGDGNQQWAYG